MHRRDATLLVTLLILAGGTVGALVFEGRKRDVRTARGEEFQRIVGGVGFGPAIDLSGCAFGFDPRLDGSCSEECGPIPGGACFCPRHAGSLFYYRPLDHGKPLSLEREGDAPPP